MISVPQTASFSVDLAREAGIPAAILYNQLLYLSQTRMVKKYDKDGWFYYTAEDFEIATTYTKNTFTSAVNKLVELGYIAKQRKYINHTTTSVCHFQILKIDFDKSQEMGIGEITANGNCYNIEKEIENEPTNPPKSDLGGPNPIGGEDNFSSLSGPERSEGNVRSGEAGGRLTKDPFDAPVKDEVLSLKPDRKSQSTEDVRAWTVTRKVTKIIQDAGHRCPNEYVQLKTAIMARLKEGVPESDIIKVANRYVNETREFFKPSNKSPHKAFGVDYFYQYLNEDSGPKSESIFGRN